MRQTLLAIGLFTLLSGTAWAAKTYQVTGPVLEVKGDTIVVQKGKDKWEIQKDAATTGAAEVKVGDKVTIEYRMTAASVEAKPAKK